MGREMNGARVRELAAQLADLERKQPRHSASPSLLARLEELEEELARAASREQAPDEGRG